MVCNAKIISSFIRVNNDNLPWSIFFQQTKKWSARETSKYMRKNGWNEIENWENERQPRKVVLRNENETRAHKEKILKLAMPNASVAAAAVL